MMNLVAMGIFARVAEAKGFSAAARRDARYDPCRPRVSDPLEPS